MSKSKKLTKRQHAVLEDLFKGEKKEDEVLAMHHVARAVYEKWFAEARFAGEFERQIERAYRQSRTILASKARDAANKLVALATDGTGETTRKACLDVITRQHPAGCKAPPKAPPVSEAPAPAADVSPEAAGRLLAALAEQA